MIRFSCPACGHAIMAPDEAAGKTGKCKCGGRVRVPSSPPSIAVGEPSLLNPAPVPSSDVTLPELPEWLTRLYPNASPAVLKSLREWWGDGQQHESDGSTPACQPATAPFPPPSATLGEPSPLRAVSAPPPVLGEPSPPSLAPSSPPVARIVTFLLAIPLILCCLGIMSNSHNSSPPPEQRIPAGWDMDKLKRDADEVARDPSKTIFIPKDGSQPRVVPNPFPDPGP